MCYDDQVSIQDGALPPHDGLKTAGYKDIISILKGAARPVTLQFEMGELPPELMSADQAKRALQLHIATQGGSNVEKITRLRRASMAQGSRAGGAAGRVASAASSPVASPRAGGGATTVTLGRPGPLGIKFQQAVDGSTVIGHVNDGSQVDLMRSWPPTSTQTQALSHHCRSHGRSRSSSCSAMPLQPERTHRELLALRPRHLGSSSPGSG